MGNTQPNHLQERVINAAEALLKRNRSVGPLELLQEMRLLEPCHVEGWRKGIEYYPTLEPSIQGSPTKLAKSFRYFEEWARARGLRPLTASYLRSNARGGTLLQVTSDGNPEREKFFRTHYAPADLPETKTQQLKAKLNKAPDLVVFQTVSDEVKCSECGGSIFDGNFLFMEKGQPLCLTCADLDHLVFLPSGNMALSRRARKGSSLSAVVVRFNRSRKRYERQGLLVTLQALSQAEEECASDESERAARRVLQAARRDVQDRGFIGEMTQAILECYPGCPAAEATRIAAHTAEKGSGRVGRSAAGRSLEAPAITLAVVAHIRHQHTNYDALLMQGTERLDARRLVREQIDAVMARWSTRLGI